MREREILLKRIEVKSLEREVRILQERLDRGSEDEEQCGRPEAETIGTPSQSRDSTSSASKRHRTLGDDDLPPSKRVPPTSGIKLVAPEKYNGKSISAMKEYISSCETTFRLSKSNYPDDATKVLYASQFLTGETKRAWLCLEQTKGKDNITWDEYTEWLQDQLQNPVTRASTLARKYDEAAQRPNQTVIQFVNYLDDLEAELPPYLDEHRRQHLLAKLSPEIRHALNNYQHIPETRTGLINLAIQPEGNMSSQSKPASEPREGHKSNRDDKGKGKVKSHGQSKSTQNVSAGHSKSGN